MHLCTIYVQPCLLYAYYFRTNCVLYAYYMNTICVLFTYYLCTIWDPMCTSGLSLVFEKCFWKILACSIINLVVCRIIFNVLTDWTHSLFEFRLLEYNKIKLVY